jgi:hypothetical protein
MQGGICIPGGIKTSTPIVVDSFQSEITKLILSRNSHTQTAAPVDVPPNLK